MELPLTKKEEITKADINMAVHDIKEKLESGEIDPLLLLQHFKAVDKIQEQIKEQLTKACIDQADKYPEKTLLLYGAEFKKGEFGTSYSYEDCKDPIWKDLKEQFDKADKALKKRQDFLKNIDGSETIIDISTAEIVTIYPPSKRSTTSVSCSIK